MNNLITVGEAAELFRCSSKTVYRWIQQKHLPESAVVRIGTRTIRLDRRQIEQAIASDGELRRWSSRPV